jgi:peptidoglycan hydrolase-like protein with peptidoglycan-binding domain
LVEAGYLQGEPAGVWDKATSAAMTRYQKDNDLPVTGKPEARTLIKLGLGPETAGKGAPVPRSTSEPEKEEGSKPAETGSR